MKKILTVLTLLNLYTFNLFAQWQPDVRLTNDPWASTTSNSNAWCLASSGNVLHAVWFDNRNGNSEIYYKRSTDGGTSWGADTRLTNSSGISDVPSVSVSGSVVHVVWRDNRDGNPEIYYKRSTDGGTSWETDTRLTNNTANSLSPSVTVSVSVVYVVWFDGRDGNNEIYYKRSTDGGTSWGADTRLTNNSAASYDPSVSVSGSVVHVVWRDHRDGNSEIYYNRSTDGGTSWGADTRQTNDPAASFYPSVSVSGAVAHVVWYDGRDGNNEIYYKRSTDGGTSWGADTNLSNNSANSWHSSGTVSGSVVHVVWDDNRDGNDEIYYKHSTDGGTSWGADTRLTNNSAGSDYPYVSASGSVVHVVWYDNRDGNTEIYYKRDSTGNPSGSSLSLNLTAFIEGFYNPVSNNMISDTTSVYLRNASSPYNSVDSSKGILSSSGTGTFLFSNAVNGVNYYIEVKHRNSIETWSKTTVSFSGGSQTYDFSNAANKAYGDNQKEVDAAPVRFSFYSGDYNQDGFVNLADVIEVYNAASSFVNGYVTSDMNGDDITDLSDVIITNNNSNLFVNKMRP